MILESARPTYPMALPSWADGVNAVLLVALAGLGTAAGIALPGSTALAEDGGGQECQELTARPLKLDEPNGPISHEALSSCDEVTLY